MLQMRARAFAARDLFADALKGIKSVEELRDYPDERVERDITPAAAAPAPRAVAAQLQECTPEKFTENAPAWRDLVLSGKKTSAALISMLSTKTILSEEQKLTIDSWAHEGE